MLKKVGHPKMKRLFAAILACLSIPLAAAEDNKNLQFNRDIRPILSENCYKCHGPDKGNRKGKLRLDQREAAIAKAIAPGKPAESELIKRIFSTDPEEQMPPPESHKVLAPAQKELLKRWIAAGAEYQPHWAYIAPLRPPVPAVQKQDWVRNPIDAFIAHALELKGIQPSKEAGRAMLLRRLSLDLVGLPPTPEETAAFVADADKDPKAYEKAIDRMLASPHFGERMAVPWLDAVRFADTVGYHGDQNMNIFPYRDYVIDSFNKNKPFDQFTIEQLAGDLLPNPTPEQRVATGFNRLNMVTREGGAQPKEYLAKYEADRVRTVSGAWMGSTMGCCECHDHKFDPFTAKDFYQMEAFFADLKQWGVYSDYTYTPNPDLKGWSNDHPFPPEIEVESPYLKQRLEKLRGRVSEIVKLANARMEPDAAAMAAFSKWLGSMAEFLKSSPTGWMTPECAVSTKETAKKEEKDSKTKDTKTVEETKPPPPEPKFSIQPDGSILFTEKSAAATEFTLKKLPPWLAVIKLELLPDEKNQNTIFLPGVKSQTVKIAASIRKQGENKEQSLAFRFADANVKQPVYKSGFATLGIKNEWKISDAHSNETLVAFWMLESPRPTSEGDTLTVKIPECGLGRLRISVSPLSFESDLNPEFDLALRDGLAGAQDSAAVRENYLRSTAWDAAAYGELKKVETEMQECRHGRAMTLVTEAIKPQIIRVLARGNWQDETGEIVQPAPPRFLPQIPNPENRRLTRLDLAKWLVAPENPLTSRALMNRLWKQFFGAGLSAVADDLGGQGEWPVHPELLDWLAVEFRESGWNFKHMVKLIAMSSVYRQDSNLRTDLKDIDPGNRLLASQSPRRLEGEFVRDNALFIAGLLNLDVGGPSAHPYQPRGYYAALQFPDRDYVAEADERQYRRGVYSHWQRTFLNPMLANFDAPSRDECTCARSVANTPQQALTLLNDPTFVEAARVFAQHALSATANSDAERIDLIFQRALARPAKAKEKESLLSFLESQRAHYKSGGDDPKKLIGIGFTPAPDKIDPVELAAWTELCRVVINLHESITRY